MSAWCYEPAWPLTPETKRGWAEEAGDATAAMGGSRPRGENGDSLRHGPVRVLGPCERMNPARQSLKRVDVGDAALRRRRS